MNLIHFFKNYVPIVVSSPHSNSNLDRPLYSIPSCLSKDKKPFFLDLGTYGRAPIKKRHTNPLPPDTFLNIEKLAESAIHRDAKRKDVSVMFLFPRHSLAAAKRKKDATLNFPFVFDLTPSGRTSSWVFLRS